jgi:hypothetical protein
MANFGDIGTGIALTGGQSVRRNAGDTAFEAFTPGSGGSGDVVGPVSSVANEIVLFDGITGKLIKSATTTGIVKATAGVISAAVGDTDYALPATVALKAPLMSPSFTTPSLGVATATSINGATITSGVLNGTVTGTNTGDQTSIVGITGTKAQFDTAVTDGDILYVGDVTQYTDEMAQDAVGGVVANSTFVSLAYNDATPSLTPSLSATGTPSSTTFLRGDNTWAVPTGGSGDVTGQASSVDSEIALFSGTTGKVIKRATNTGILKASSGVIATATSGTDYAPATSGTGILKGNGSGGFSTATPITDYLPGYTVVATLASDQATGANTTPVTLTGLVFTYEANSKYLIECMALVQPTAATTGCGFQFDLSSAVTSIWVQFDHQLANTGTLSGGHSIADDASVGVSSGMPGTSTYPVRVHGLLITTSNTGTAQLRFRSETTAVTTCKAGTTLIVRKIA